MILSCLLFASLQKLSKADNNADKVILHIERQAVMEVVIQVIVNSFDIDDQIGMKNVCLVY